MAKNIGKYAVQLSADARPLVQASAQAKQALAAVGAQAAQTARAAAKAAAGVATLGTVAVGLAAAAPVVWLKRMAEGMEQADRQARKLGVSIGELRGLHLAGGAAAEQMANMVGLLNLNLARSAQGDLAAKGLFAGVGGTGGLAGGPEGLAQVLDRLAAIPDAAKRAAQAFRILGGDAAEILPHLEQGGGGVRAAQDQARRMGLFVGAEDVKTAREVANIFREIKALWEGVQNQVFLALAPLVAELRSRLDLSGIDISGWRDAILDTVDTVGLHLAKAIDSLADGSLWQAVKDKGIDAAKAIGAAMREAMGLPDAAGMSAGLSLLLDTLGITLGRGGGNAPNPLDTNNMTIPKAFAPGPGKAEQGWLDFITGARARAGGNAAGPGAGGWGGIDARGLFAPFMQEIVAKFDQALQGVQAGRPLVGLQQGMNDLKGFDQFGLFDGLPGAKERMAADVFGKFRGAVGAQPQQFAGAALENTKEAYSAIIRHQDPNRRVNVQEEMKRLMEEAKHADEEKLRIGRETLQAIEKMGGRVAGID